MHEIVEMTKHKLMRFRQLATLRYVHWLFLQRFRPEILLTTQMYDGVRIQYLPRGDVSRDLYLGQYEPDVIDFLSHYLKPGMIMLDVGANIGVYTLLSAKIVGEHGSVHAFEPTPKTFAQLHANIELNGFTCVHINRLAVTEKAGTSTLYLYEQNAMNSLFIQNWVGKPLGRVEVETISLDQYINTNDLPRVDLLKLDVEGAELGVLKGALKLLAGLNSPVIICEFADRTASAFGYKATAIRDFLAPLGYQFYRWDSVTSSLVPEPNRPNYKIYANLICSRNQLEIP